MDLAALVKKNNQHHSSIELHLFTRHIYKAFTQSATENLDQHMQCMNITGWSYNALNNDTVLRW